MVSSVAILNPTDPIFRCRWTSVQCRRHSAAAVRVTYAKSLAVHTSATTINLFFFACRGTMVFPPNDSTISETSLVVAYAQYALLARLMEQCACRVAYFTQGSKTEILPLDLRNSIGMASAPKKIPTLGYMLRTVRSRRPSQCLETFTVS